MTYAAKYASAFYGPFREMAEAGLLEKEVAMMEVLYSIKRAGADIIITYFAKEAAKLL